MRGKDVLTCQVDVNFVMVRSLNLTECFWSQKSNLSVLKIDQVHELESLLIIESILSESIWSGV